MLVRDGFGSEKAITASDLKELPGVKGTELSQAVCAGMCWDAFPILQKSERSEMGERSQLPSPH